MILLHLVTNNTLVKRYAILLIVLTSFYWEAIAQHDATLSSYTNQTEIVARNSITLKPGFHIPAGKTVRIYTNSSLVNFPNLQTQLSTGQNYILTRTFREPVTVAQLGQQRTVGQENQTVQYFDGLGRPLQTVQVQASPGYKDIVQHIEYDGFGRESRKYLPYTRWESNGAFKSGGGDSVVAFYTRTTGSNIAGIVRTPNPYAVTVFENSPLNRVLEQGAPGTAWQPAASRSTTTGRTVVTEYGTNTASGPDAVKLWKMNTNDIGASGSTNYTAGRLYKTVIRDENWVNTNAPANPASRTGTVEEYKDFEGRVVLKRVWESEIKALNTYYVYDDFGDLRYVIPPAYTANAFVEAVTGDFHEFIYVYRYDGRRRLIEKKIPGKVREYLVYNRNDQVVLTQDSIQRAGGKWSYTKYDAFGRVASTGIYTNTTASQTTRKQVQALADAVTAQWENRVAKTYTNTAFPSTASQLAEYTVNYYDDYSFKDAGILSASSGLDSTRMVRGLLTGTKVAKDDGTLPLLTVHYYDKRAQLVETVSQNHIGGTDRVTNTYNFPGELLTSTRVHTPKTGSSTTIVTTNSYDHVGRLLATRHYIDDVNKEVTLARNEYNEIGQLKQKSSGGNRNGADFHTAVSYAYNERGWTTRAASPHFTYQLNYNVNSTGSTIAGAQYNGNIAEQHWAHASATLSNVFKYSYDPLNRLKNGTSTGTVMSEALTYDDMGNIRTLSRNVGSTPTMVTNTFTYQNNNRSNRLESLSTGGSYTYDLNGNATRDRTGMNIRYNHLNLPDSAWNTTNTVKVGYLYDALGTKLRKYSTQGGTRDYVNGMEYSGTAIELVHTPEGVVLRKPDGTYSYRYNLTDHLGNVRSTIYRNPSNNNAVEILQKDDYYPFGMRRVVAAGTNKYLYNSKEIQGELGDQYDYGARFYDPEIGRWNVVDPLAEKYLNLSPYGYVANDPINLKDPDGKKIVLGTFDNETNKNVKLEYRNGNFYHGKEKLDMAKIGDRYGIAIHHIDAAFKMIENSGNEFLNKQLSTLIKSKNTHVMFDIYGSDRTKSFGVNANGSSVNDPQNAVPISTKSIFDFSPRNFGNREYTETPQTIVVHEMRHMYDYDIGNMKDNTNKSNVDNPSEMRAVHSENVFRKIYGIPERKTYDGKMFLKSKLVSPPNNK